MKFVLAVLLASASYANAATITVGAPALTGPGLVTEDFSSFAVCGQSGPLSTSVGTFSTSGGPGQQGTVCGDTNSAQVRQGTSAYIALSGRHNPLGDYWLDSNDNELVTLTTTARRVWLQMSDLADKRPFFRLDAGDASYSISELHPNAGLFTFLVDFGNAGGLHTIAMHTTRNDGFSVGPVIAAPIPLPAAGLLLLGALGALAASRGMRRKLILA